MSLFVRYFIICTFFLTFIFTTEVFAGRTINSATLNGSSNVIVGPSASVNAALNVTTSGSGSNHNWQSTSWQIGSDAPVCVDSPNISSSGTYTQNFTVTAPATFGNYDISFTAYRNTGCSPSNDSNIFTLPNAITVAACNQFSGIIDPLEFEGGNFTIQDTYSTPQFTHVIFSNKFSSTPAVFVLPTTDGSNTANVRIKNVTRTGFDIATAEPVGEDGAHVAMNVAYFAINKGIHKIGNTYLEVGILSTHKVKPVNGVNQNETYGWDVLSPRASFCNPAIVANIQTMVNEPSYVPNNPSKPFLVPAIITNGSDINITLDKVPTSGNHEVNNDEQIAYMIAEGNIQDHFIDTNGKTIQFETIKTGAIFPGWNNSPSTGSANFVNTYTKAPMIAATKVSNNEDEPAWFRSKSISKTAISMTIDESNDWPTNNERSHAKEAGSIFAFSEAFYIFTGVCQYVKSKYQTTTDGYYYVDEGISDIYGLKPFEIYCENMNSDGALAYLPTLINQNNSDNSNFKFNTTHNNNYYSTGNSKTYFDKIKVSNQFTSEATSFANGDFSNINLSGTSFRMDINNALLSGCDSATNHSLLRIGTQEQVIKIDPKVQTQPSCHVDGMSFNQISNYYAKDDYIQNGFSSCQEISEYQAGLPNGYYLLNKPLQIAGQSKYYVTYCDMAPPSPFKALSQLLVFDGKTTQSKNDIASQSDTCSKLGLSFFAPNTEATMDATRQFLLTTKSGWEDYAGTIQEYFNDHGISGWATDSQTSDLKPNPIPNGAMWPYGPLGIYKPSNSASNSDKKMAKSTKWLTNAEKSQGFGSLDETGWTSILPEINPAYPVTEWFVANLAAGYKPSPDLSARSPKVIEPNGDYDANNWLGWFADTNGYIVHFNDQNGVNRYSYTNYMCMTRNNYLVNPPVVVKNTFDAWDSFRSINDRNISTKIVNKPFAITVASINETNSAVQDFNGTVCVQVLNSADQALSGWNQLLFNDQNTSNTTFTITRAVGGSDYAKIKLSWKKNTNTTCPITGEDNSTIASDYFSIRPASFSITAPNAVAGVNFDIIFTAPMYGSTSASADYNQSSGGSFDFTAVEHNASCPMGVFTPPLSSVSFSNGIQTFTTRYSEVGVLDLNLSDTAKPCAARYTNIDCDDANVSDGTNFTADLLPIGLTQKQITIKPDHFDVNATLSNFGGGFTYLSDDLNMSAQLDLIITAKNGEGNTTKNYDRGCYAKTTSLSLPHSSVPSPLTRILYYDSLNLTETNITTSNPITSSYTASNFTQGSATPQITINFDRSRSYPMNPFDFTITSATATDPDTTGTGTPLGTAKFVYGRVHAYDVTTNVSPAPNPIEFEVYSTTSGGFVSGMPQNVLHWYRNLNHDAANQGNVIRGGFSAGTSNSNVDVSAAPQDGVQIVTITSATDQTVHLDISKWLWYSSKYNYLYSGTCSQHPCFNYDYTDANAGVTGVNSGNFNGSDFNMTPAKNITNKGVKLFR